MGELRVCERIRIEIEIPTAVPAEAGTYSSTATNCPAVAAPRQSSSARDAEAWAPASAGAASEEEAALREG
jgi:hypothetical protein